MARADVGKWAEWSKINVALNFTAPIFWRGVRTAPVDQDAAAINRAVAPLDKMLDIAGAQLLRGSFLAGDNFTLACIQFGHVLFRDFDIPITRQSRPALRRHYDALTTRPAPPRPPRGIPAHPRRAGGRHHGLQGARGASLRGPGTKHRTDERDRPPHQPAGWTRLAARSAR